MGQLDTWNVERHRALALSNVQHLRSGDVQNLGIGINKPPDQPGTSEPIDLRAFTRDPFHLSLHGRARKPSEKVQLARLGYSVSVDTITELLSL
jgi:hypothetical protein